MRHLLPILPVLLAAAAPVPAFAQVQAADSGDTAWMLTCALFVCLAAVPGSMLRHAGQARAKDALSIMAQGAVIVAGVSLLWAMIGYSLAYAPGGRWLGGGANILLSGLAPLRDGLTVPESAFALFQLGLALLAAGIVAGAVAGRARFGWVAIFAPLWTLLVYAPVAHWMWGGGWLADLGALDFSGAIVLNVSAGVSALVATLMVGRRSGIRARPEHDSGHAPVLTLGATGLVWIGWFGVGGGWAPGASDDAATAILNIHFAACAAALGWAAVERLRTGRVSATGIASGAVAGLVAISASAGLVGAGGAMLIGLIAGACCQLATGLAARLRADDVGNVVAIHAVGGMLGALLLAPFTLPALGGVGFAAGVGLFAVLATQAVAIAAVALWSALGTAIADRKSVV